MRNDNARAIRINVCAAVEKFKSGLEAIQNDNGPAKGMQTQYIFWNRSGKSVVKVVGKMEMDAPNFCLQSCSNIQRLSMSCKVFPRIGRPFGPGGSLRHGLLAYRAERMMTRLKTRPMRGARSWERGVKKRQ